MARIPLSKLLAASLAGHSALYRWMLEHADDLERAISVANRPNWPALARTFGEAGLTDRNGNPPNPEVARQTWFKVRKALAAQAALLPSPRRSPTMRHAVGARAAVPPTETTANDPEEPEFVTLTGKKIPTRKP
jgi:hypothetical protein